MTTYTQDPALPIEDLTPNQGQPEAAAASAPQAAPATIEVDELDQFVKILTGWHSQKVKVLEHYLKLQENPEAVIEMQVGEESTIKLEGDILVGLKAGINLALMEMGRLPFAVEYEKEEAAAAGA